MARGPAPGREAWCLLCELRSGWQFSWYFWMGHSRGSRGPSSLGHTDTTAWTLWLACWPGGITNEDIYHFTSQAAAEPLLASSSPSGRHSLHCLPQLRGWDFWSPRMVLALCRLPGPCCGLGSLRQPDVGGPEMPPGCGRQVSAPRLLDTFPGPACFLSCPPSLVE